LPIKSAFAKGRKLYLRPLERTDLTERYQSWLNDPDVTLYMEAGVFPTTLQQLEKYYQEVTSSPNQVILAVIHQKSDLHIGNVKLGPINWVHRRAALGILIGDKEFWGRGLGTEAVCLAVEYGFYRLNLHRIGLGVFEEHKSAVRCYQKVGFKIEGHLREDVFRDGQYKNGLWMGLLRSEYKSSGNGPAPT
jgi:[ribosomal protein S5]-alanine N-acetyltransferase